MTPDFDRDDALFLDFDGTLVEIAGGPSLVHVEPGLPRLLNGLLVRQGGALAIVSGREIDELTRILDPYAGPMAGIHGLERRRADGTLQRPEPLPFLDHARAMVDGFATKTPGIEVEDKGLGLALHFRSNPEQGFACLQLAREIVWLSGQRFKVTQGKMVVEVHPVGANKGRAILDFMSEPPFRGRRPIYIGDDRPDESGFVFVNHLGGISILVGASVTSAAQYRFSGVSAVINWLAHSASLPSGPRCHAAS